MSLRISCDSGIKNLDILSFTDFSSSLFHGSVCHYFVTILPVVYMVEGPLQNPGEDYAFSSGDVCKVEPTNALKKKHRGRIYRLTGTYREYGLGTLKIGAIFLDTGKFGYVDAGDLIPAPPDEVAAQPHQ